MFYSHDTRIKGDERTKLHLLKLKFELFSIRITENFVNKSILKFFYFVTFFNNLVIFFQIHLV